MDENAKGGKTYSRIIQSVRATNQPVGSAHHKYDKHFKKWCEGKTPEEILEAVDPPKRKRTSKTDHVKTLSKKETKIISTKVASAKVVPVTKTKEMLKAERDKRIKEKYEQMKKQKLADSLKSNCRCAHIKSVGNGL